MTREKNFSNTSIISIETLINITQPGNQERIENDQFGIILQDSLRILVVR